MSRIRIAATADLHCRVDSQGRYRRTLGRCVDEADVLLIAGDLTDHGLVEEAEVLAADLETIRLPKIAVMGNHDWESDRAPDVARILTHAGLKILQGDVYVLEKRLGFAGVKGFCGGYEDCTLQAWGEEPIKKFVFEAVNEALKLEMALAKLVVLNIPTKIAVTHYSPIRQTLVGEKTEIFPFMGCSRLGETIDNQGVTAAFHGHAHHGTLVGHTPRGVPVYNVAMPLLKAQLERRYAVIELEVPAQGETPWQTSKPPQPPRI